MNKIKGIEELREQLSAFEQDISESIQQELTRVNRAVSMEEFSFIPFNEDVSGYMDAIRLDSEGQVVLDTSFHDCSEKHLSACIADNEIDHWNMIGLLELLKDTPPVKLKRYRLKGKSGKNDISFTIDDLIPLTVSKKYNYDRLVRLINNRDYDTDWNQPMQGEYAALYGHKRNEKVDFFKIKGTQVIVMPGIYIYPTILTEAAIKNF